MENLKMIYVSKHALIVFNTQTDLNLKYMKTCLYLITVHYHLNFQGHFWQLIFNMRCIRTW